MVLSYLSRIVVALLCVGMLIPALAESPAGMRLYVLNTGSLSLGKGAFQATEPKTASEGMIRHYRITVCTLRARKMAESSQPLVA